VTDPLSFDEAEQRLDEARHAINAAHWACEVAGEHAADAEAVYRSELAKAFKGYRSAGKGVEESMTLARADAAQRSRERDDAAHALKLAFEKLEDARDDRRSLWRLVEWSREVDARSR